MGERKGQNLYYPPDYDPKKGGLNKFMGTHALRERARKLHMGILIIRFEMPFNIWCNGCGNHIGMGVRYNAEKKKVGMYYTTPVYQFRMKCHLCDNHFEIKTNPGALDYDIISGARRQENRWDPTENEQIVPEDKVTSRRLFDDAMFKLEHKNEDLDKSKKENPRLRNLQHRNEIWRDDFAANYELRRMFRDNKRRLKNDQQTGTHLLKKSSLAIKLVHEHPDDIKTAADIFANVKRKPVAETQKLKSNKKLSFKTQRLLNDTSLQSQIKSSVKKTTLGAAGSLVSDYHSDSSDSI